jgi:hypothetical protein
MAGALKLISSEPYVTTLAATDGIVAVLNSGNLVRLITLEDLIAEVLGGSNTLTLGGNLDVQGNSVIDGSLIGDMTGGGTVATGGFTATIPATGTVALRGTTNTFTGLITASAGVNFGQDTLSYYDVGPWTPTAYDAPTAGNQASAVTVSKGWYERRGTTVEVWGRLSGINTTGMTAGNGLYIRGLPFAAATDAADDAYGIHIGSCRLLNCTFSGYVVPVINNTTSYVRLFEVVSTTAGSGLIISDLTSTTADIMLHVTYRCTA